MTFQGAVLREQGVPFAIVITHASAFQTTSEGQETIRSLQPLFPGIPLVLMAQDSRGVPTYFGRKDIVNFLSHISIARIPWKQYNYAT